MLKLPDVFFDCDSNVADTYKTKSDFTYPLQEKKAADVRSKTEDLFGFTCPLISVWRKQMNDAARHGESCGSNRM